MNNRNSKGFTIVELTLVMAIMSLLLMAILYLTIFAGQLYTKGITNKSLNQLSRDVSDTIRRDIFAASAGSVQIPAQKGLGVEKRGALCTGRVSYIWNTAMLLNNATATKYTYKTKPVRFARVIDPDSALCAAAASDTVPDHLALRELLATDDRSYAVYEISFEEIARNVNDQGLYKLRVVVGTNEKSTTTIDPITGFQCLPPSKNTANFDYCTVSEFTTILRAGGEAG